MAIGSNADSMKRREFLTKTGSGLLAAAALPADAAMAAPKSDALADTAALPPPPSRTPSPAAKKKIPIGVFNPVYDDLSIDAMLDKVTALGLEAMEIGTGGYPNNKHCPLDDLIADKAKAKAWLKKFEDRNIRVATLSCHGNPVHPNATHAAKDADNLPQNRAARGNAGSESNRRVFRMSGRNAARHPAELDHLPLAAGIQ